MEISNNIFKRKTGHIRLRHLLVPAMNPSPLATRPEFNRLITIANDEISKFAFIFHIFTITHAAVLSIGNYLLFNLK